MRGSLTAGLPDLSQFGPQLLVPFGAHPLPEARVVWLNTWWLTQRGCPVGLDADLRRRTEAWVLEQFAFSAGGDRTVHADRYGDPRGTSPHGGSGRVATVGRFQVKGIGRTPLVGDATWIHSHGLMSLTEAVCEGIHGEILDAELPFGALPVIAIIDCGETMKTPHDELRRALVVRPAALRPAHLLRAASFVGATDLVVTPSPDAARVRDAISRVASMSDADRSQINLPRDLADLLDRLARQAATADALRLFTGGLFAGNVSLTGALLDFGVARALYSWASLQLHSHARGFGQDLERLVNFASRRWWPGLPADWAVTSQRVIQGCSALEGSSGEGAAAGWWLEGWLCDSRFVWGAAELGEDQIQRLEPRVQDGRWHCTVRQDGLPAAISRQFGRAAHLAYPAPPRWWKVPA